jgi:mannitol/fructose-specific phosphotransferase system IIA component (Ntr-type)
MCLPSFIYGQELASVRPRTDEAHFAEDIYIREQSVMTIHQESSYDPEVRARAIADKLNYLYSKGISTDKIYYKKEIKKVEENGKVTEKPAGASIYWGEEKLITLLICRVN